MKNITLKEVTSALDAKGLFNLLVEVHKIDKNEAYKANKKYFYAPLVEYSPQTTNLFNKFCQLFDPNRYKTNVTKLYLALERTQNPYGTFTRPQFMVETDQGKRTIVSLSQWKMRNYRDYLAGNVTAGGQERFNNSALNSLDKLRQQLLNETVHPSHLKVAKGIDEVPLNLF
jgi:hypothetical protein